MKLKILFFYVGLFLCISSQLCTAKPTNSCDNTFVECVKIPKSCQTCCDDQLIGKTFFSIRPQDSNSANRLVRIVNEDHSLFNDCFEWGCDVSVGYQQSFGRSKKDLGKWFLFNGCDCMDVGVTSTGSAQTFDVDGRQLGLVLTTTAATGSLGELCLNPRLQNVNAVFNLWFDLNRLLHGLWVRTVFSLTRARTTLGMESTTTNAWTGDYPSGVYTVLCNQVPVAYTTVCSAFVGNNYIGDIPPLEYAKFYSGSKSKLALASVRFDVGEDFIKSAQGFFNASVCFLIPTGNRPESLYLFEPIVGANRSWQLGVAFTGAYTDLYASGKNSLDLFVDITMTHLFKSQQQRVFTLANNGPGSQYLLLKNFDVSLDALLGADRAANIFVGKAKIGANIMIDGSIMLHWSQLNGLFCDLGYNLWYRSSERLGKTALMRNFALTRWGVKGNEPMTEGVGQSCFSNLQTASESTISTPATADATTTFLQACDINFGAALHPSAYSNKLFVALGYSNVLHSFGSHFATSIEAEVEFGQKNSALNQWAININFDVAI